MTDKINDGGPAFPSLNAEFTGISSDGQERYDIQPSGGMSLRNYAAIKAMQGICAHSDTWGLPTASKIAAVAYEMADAMIAASEVKHD